MICRLKCGLALFFGFGLFAAAAGPVIDFIPNVSVPAGKSLTIPITASSTNGRPLTYTVTSSTNRISVEVHTNNPFWKLSVVQVCPSNAPGAYLTPFRGALAMVTNVGDMTFLLLRDRAPRTVDAIAGLTASGFYSSNTIFHRVSLVPYFIIQGGDPATNGSGGPVFQLDDEFHPRSLFSGKGQLGAANSGVDTVGSQFFITAAPQRAFDLRYTVFGQLVRGYNTLSNVLYTPTNSASRPLRDVIITRASIVTNYTDTAITLTGTNLVGVMGTIRVIADDGVGGRVTNTFTATTISDAANNNQPILGRPAITNLIVPVNGRLTNRIAATDLDKNTMYFDAYYSDLDLFGNSLSKSNSFFALYPGTDGQFILVPSNNYSGPLEIYLAVSPDPFFFTYDYQKFTVAVGDTPITAAAGSPIVAHAGIAFSNVLLATFTNGIPNSSPTNFSAAIHWGDNSTDTGVLFTNLIGGKEVRRSHTFTNAGTYPVYIRVRSNKGAEATVSTSVFVQPSLTLTRAATNTVLRWPAWAADYLPQTHTNVSSPNWTTLTNLPVLVGYEHVLTNPASPGNVFFRLKR
jgi:cyclophilin family peptidyl-prolyl cis-trans isomerase